MVLANYTISLGEMLQQGMRLQQEGKLDEAEQIFMKVLGMEPENFNALHLMGVIKYMRGEYEGAVKFISRAAQINPSFAEVRYNLGGALKQLGHKEEAIKEYQTAVMLKPGYKAAETQLWALQRNSSGKFFSEHGQDEYVYENFFADKRGGFFLDVGAFDGINGNNTLFFEKEMGWDGICIEPSAQQFQKLQSVRSCKCINTCVSDFEGMADFMHVTSGPKMVSGLLNSYVPFRFEKIVNMQNKEHEIISVKVSRLSKILKEQKVKHIDYCTIDVEGAELHILRDINFSDVFIDVLSVENNNNNLEIKKHMRSQGYAYVINVGEDEIYKRNS